MDAVCGTMVADALVVSDLHAMSPDVDVPGL